MRPILVLACLVPFAISAQESDFPRQVDLFVAGQTVLKIPHLLKVAVGDAEIADIRTIGNTELLVIGSSPGQTTLRVWLEGAPAWIDVKVVVTRSLLVKPPSLAEVVLKIGETRALDTPHVARIAIGDTDIADVNPTGNDAVTLKGVAEGATTLIWWADNSRHELLVRVTK